MNGELTSKPRSLWHMAANFDRRPPFTHSVTPLRRSSRHLRPNFVKAPRSVLRFWNSPPHTLHSIADHRDLPSRRAMLGALAKHKGRDSRARHTGSYVTFRESFSFFFIMLARCPPWNISALRKSKTHTRCFCWSITHQCFRQSLSRSGLLYIYTFIWCLCVRTMSSAKVRK